MGKIRYTQVPQEWLGDAVASHDLGDWLSEIEEKEGLEFIQLVSGVGVIGALFRERIWPLKKGLMNPYVH